MSTENIKVTINPKSKMVFKLGSKGLKGDGCHARNGDTQLKGGVVDVDESNHVRVNWPQEYQTPDGILNIYRSIEDSGPALRVQGQSIIFQLEANTPEGLDLMLEKNRPGGIQPNDSIINIWARANDGYGNFLNSSLIKFDCRNPSEGKLPGRIRFCTANNDGDLKQAMIINPEQHIRIGETAATAGDPKLSIISDGDEVLTLLKNGWYENSQSLISFGYSTNNPDLPVSIIPAQIYSLLKTGSVYDGAELHFRTKNKDFPATWNDNVITHDGKVGINWSNPDGRLHIYHPYGSPEVALRVQGQTSVFQVEGEHPYPVNIFLEKNKSALVLNDRIGQILARGPDGFGNFLNSSQIIFSVDGTVINGVIPGRITLSTSNDSGLLRAGLQITKDQIVKIYNKLDFGSTTRSMINLWGGETYSIGIQSATQYYRTAAIFAWFRGGVHTDGTIDPGPGGLTDMVLVEGNLGIGLNNPDSRLHVDGNIKATGDLCIFGSTFTKDIRASNYKTSDNRIGITKDVVVKISSGEDYKLLRFKNGLLVECINADSLDILTGGVASCDSYESETNLPIYYANDDDYSTRWTSSGSPFPHWWKYDLGEGVTKIVTKLRLLPNYYSDTSLKNFKLQGSNNDSDWTDIYTGQHANNDSWEEYIFSNSTPYRYYRLFAIDGWVEQTFFGLWEIEMFE